MTNGVRQQRTEGVKEHFCISRLSLNIAIHMSDNVRMCPNNDDVELSSQKKTPRALIYLSRIFFIMKLTGIYLNDHRTPRKYRVPYAIFAVFALILSCLDVIRILTLFDMSEQFGAQVVNKVTALVAHAASLLVYTCCFFSRNHFVTLINSWERLLKHRTRTSDSYPDYSLHLRKVSIVLYCLICAVPLGLLIYFIFYTANSEPTPDPREILIPHW